MDWRPVEKVRELEYPESLLEPSLRTLFLKNWKGVLKHRLNPRLGLEKAEDECMFTISRTYKDPTQRALHTDNLRRYRIFLDQRL